MTSTGNDIFKQRFLRILLSLCGMGAALAALCACVYVFACVADADWRRVPVAPANTLLPENEGRFVRLCGALEVHDKKSGRLGAYRIHFHNELTCDDELHPPEPGANALLVGYQSGDSLRLWYNLSHAPMKWRLCSHIVQETASEYTLLPDFVLAQGLILLGALFLFLLAFMCWLRASRLGRASECA